MICVQTVQHDFVVQVYNTIISILRFLLTWKTVIQVHRWWWATIARNNGGFFLCDVFCNGRIWWWSTSETQFPIKVETCYIRMQQRNAIFIFRKRKKWPKKQFQFSILLVWPTWFPKCLFNADKRTEVFFSPKAVKSFCAVLSRSLCLQPECRPLFFSRLPFVGVRLKGKRFRVYGPKCGSTLI